MTPVLVGIAGGSGSGKSTFAERLQTYFPGRSVIVRQDDYYLPHDRVPLAERVKINYDTPEALDSALLREHLLALRSGEDIECPIYDYTRHTRSEKTRTVACAQVILVEGMLVLAEAGLRELFDLTVFVDVPEAERLARRVARDVRERGRSEQSVREQFSRTVAPMHERYVEPTAVYAAVRVTGGGDNVTAAQEVVLRIKGIQEKKQCLLK